MLILRTVKGGGSLGGTEVVSSTMLSIDAVAVSEVWGYRFAWQNLEKKSRKWNENGIHIQMKTSPHVPAQFSIMEDMYIYVCRRGNWTGPHDAIVRLSIRCVILLTVWGMYSDCWTVRWICMCVPWTDMHIDPCDASAAIQSFTYSILNTIFILFHLRLQPHHDPDEDKRYIVILFYLMIHIIIRKGLPMYL